MALSIQSARLPSSETPVCGVTLEPYVLVRRGDASPQTTAEEVPEEGSGDSRFSLRFRWYRSVINRGGAVCCVHPDREATIQCLLCLKTKVETRKSYHCSTDCLKFQWESHKNWHESSRAAGGENGYTTFTSDANYQYKFSGTQSNGGETWIEVGRTRLYTPSPEDVGFVVKFEVTSVDSTSPYSNTAKPIAVTTTSRVRPAPTPPKRSMIPFASPQQSVVAGKFTALTYNVLADLYASSDQFPGCPGFALTWQYRKQNLLKELVGYRADILCLQEVQSNHYTEFLAPELQKHGYTAIYKKKTAELYTNSTFAIDGCATFFRRDRFSLVKKYEVEFNKAALSLAESMPVDQRKIALNRLLKDNVALIAVLEALDPPPPLASDPHPAAPRRQLICVANTHIHANPELNDVKLWQVHTLLKGLEKIANSADIPMLVAGDFNSTPGSAAHQLLVKRSVDANHPELQNDPLKILHPCSKLQHQLPLASAYVASSAGREPADAKARQQRNRLDPRYHEPLFTNIAGAELKLTLDYILYTTDSLAPVATLELPEESEVKLKPGFSMPNERWSSDHIALMAEFQYTRQPATA